jgi:predicted nucleic acid-binding protein
MIVASMRESGARTLYSYDADFDRLPDISRIEP